MEPCAPGTEDESPIMFSTLTKQENEQERLLKLKAILRNGKYENVFELSYLNGSEHWFCRACECPVMGRVFQHEIGKRHKQHLSNFNKYLDPLRQTKEEDIPAHDQAEEMSIAPGEPVPPGFEDEVGKVAQIQERLDGFKVGPLVALEYLVELQDYDVSKEPFYLCILCDKRGDPRTVLTHLASYNHVIQYLQKHFPTCYRSLAPYMTKQYKRNWQITLQKIAEGIEKKFGRLKPFPIDKDKFERDRVQYLTMIAKGRHFSELSGYTFEELVVHDELVKSHEDEKTYESSAATNWGGATYIQKPFKKRSPSPPVVAMPSKKSKVKTQQSATSVLNKSQNKPQTQQNQKIGHSRRDSLSSVSTVSSNDADEIDSRRNRSDDRYSRNRFSPKGRQLPYARRRSPSPRSVSPKRRRSPSPRRFVERERKRNSVERKINEKEEEKLRKLEEYKKLSRAIENDLQNTLKHHEKNPEKHPSYNEEWKQFWNRRYKELQSQGIDVAKYDFKPEWIQYWNRKMVELHSDEVRNKKEALRKRLGLPEDVNPIKFRIMSGQTNSSPKHLPMAAEPDQDNEVIIIDDKELKPSRRSHSPWEKESPPRHRGNRRSPFRSREKSPMREQRRGRPINRSVSRERLRTRSRSNRSVSREREFRMKNLSRQRDLSPSLRDRDRGREFSRNLSHSPIRDEHSRGYSPYRDRQLIRERDILEREKRSDSREKNWEKRPDLERRRVEYRESSYERDMRGKERIRTVADLPWEREKTYRVMYEGYYRPPPVMRDVSRKPMNIPPPKEEEEEDEGEINVVDVLRILTALEERLGSLGPKVIDLLAQALAMEKKEANSSETLLDNDVNCVLFETIKEKLKGQMLTGLVDMIQERAFKKAIKKIASLIHLASQRKQQREKTMPKGKAITVAGGATVDRQAIARHIANALVLQGKTDVSQAELEQLINAVVGMAEASKNSSKPVTTAGFLQQLSGGLLGHGQHMTESGDKIIIPSSAKKEVTELSKLVEPLTPSPEKSSHNMENLSDSDLQTLLQNFKDLCTEEQHNLITYLKKLEDQEPERVEKLRQFVNLEVPSKLNEDEMHGENKRSRDSPFSERIGGANPTLKDVSMIESDEDMEKEMEEKEKEKPTKIHVDSEEEDYTFEDVVKTVSKNVKDKELASNMKIIQESMKFENAKKSEVNLDNAKDLISNLMSNINKVNMNTKSVDLLGLSSSNISKPAPNLLTNTTDFAKTFSNINMASLASIVSSVQHMTSGENSETKLNFEPPTQSRVDKDIHFDPPGMSDDKFNLRFEESNLSHRSNFERTEDRPFGASGRLEERSRLDEPMLSNMPGRLTGAPPRLDNRTMSSGSARLDDRPFGGASRLDDRSFGEASRLDNRSFGGAPRLDDRPFGGTPRLDDRPFGGASRLEDRPFGNRTGLLPDPPRRLEDKPLPERLEESSFPSRSFSGPSGRLEEPAKPFSGSSTMSNFGRGSVSDSLLRGSGPMLDRDFKPRSLLGFPPRNSAPFGNIPLQFPSSVRGPRPNIPDQRPRFNNFNDFSSRPGQGGNFNRW